MKRIGFAGHGIGCWMCGVGLMAVAAAPAMADGFSIGGLFAGGKHGGTVIGGFLRIGDPAPVVAPPVVIPRPVVVPPPVIVERVWVSTPRVEYRQVPVIDAFGRVIAYRQECVTIADGHWETITRPAPAPFAAGVVVAGGGPGPFREAPIEYRGHRGNDGPPRYFAPPAGRVPAAPNPLRSTVPLRAGR